MRSFALSLLLLVSQASSAHVASEPATPASIRGSFFALSVADAPKIAAWYRVHLGFKTLSDGEVPGGKIRFALLQRENSLIEIIERSDTKSAPVDSKGQRSAISTYGVFKIGFTVSDLHALHDRLQAARVTFNHHVVQPKGNSFRTFAVRDPEGISFSSSADLRRVRRPFPPFTDTHA